VCVQDVKLEFSELSLLLLLLCCIFSQRRLARSMRLVTPAYHQVSTIREQQRMMMIETVELYSTRSLLLMVFDALL